MSKYIGQSVPRYEGLGQVTGMAMYTDDYQLPGMLYAKVLYSPVHKGVIRHLDLTPAENTPGVVGTLTAGDVPGNNAYGLVPDQPVFTPDHVRYKGERIAAVVAVDEDTAQEAVEKIKLDIEEQTPVFDMFEAMKPDAPLVRPGSDSNMWVFGNGKTVFEVRLGNIEKGLADADYVVEGRYTNANNDHAPIEPHVSVAYIDDAGRLAFHTESQAHYFHLGQLCPVFNLPMSQIVYEGGRVGGGFGSKNDVHCDHVTGLAALKFRKPVKYRMTRREHMSYGSKRGAFVFEIKDGVKKDGRIVARHFRMWHTGGAYTAFAPYAVEKCATYGLGPYAVPNVFVEGWCVFTNRPIHSSQRGFAVTNGQSAVELQMNRIAEVLGVDPWEVRFINAWREGDLGPTQFAVAGAGVIESMQKAAELAGVELPAHLRAMSSRRR
ncbi:MAG: molybdopterin-dependent oxidoreductase [Ardenticatenaceae bacterium]|nr:molybdopterin-dependent oxidoreductase [Ardenticatenaceae bacterium]